MSNWVLDFYRSVFNAIFRTKLEDGRIGALLSGRDRRFAAGEVASRASQHAWFCIQAARGDRARNARRWDKGFAAYRRALDIFPLHAGYLVQAGHCLKELGRFLPAEGYYRSALILGAPLGDVEEHLVFATRRNLQFQQPSKLRELAEAVRNQAPHVDALPTFDELCLMAEVCGFTDKVDLSLLVGLMRDGASHAQAFERLCQTYGEPRLADSYRRRAASRAPGLNHAAVAQVDGKYEHKADPASGRGAMTAPKPITPLEGDAARSDDNTRVTAPPADAPPPASPEEVRALTDAFCRGRHDQTAIAFFGAAPQRSHPKNCSLEADAMPVVSVIILNHNQARLTVLSAGSVLAADWRVPFECIVVDNASRADEREVLDEAHLPIRNVLLAENLGFGEGNNLGAETARGQYLLFLNNDAFLAPQAVGRLLAAFEEVDGCGVAGSLFRYPDGRIQEAGAFVVHDGTTLQRGKGVVDFEVNVLPKHDVVDYVSGACLMIEKHTFEALGGFHLNYDAGYSEDVDLCLRLRLGNRMAVFVRDAVCYHIENASTSSAEGRERRALVSDMSRRALLGTWDRYLATRVDSDLPLAILPQRGPTLHARDFAPDVVAYLDRPLRCADTTRYLLAFAGAVSPSAGLVQPVRPSGFRVANVTAWMGLAPRISGSLALSDLTRPVRRLVCFGGCESQRMPSAENTEILYLEPLGVGGAIRSMLAGWQSAARIIAPSRAAEAHLRAEAERHRISLPPVVVLPGSVPIGPASDIGPRRRLIVSLGSFDAAGPNAGHGALIAAASRLDGARKNWQFLLCGSVDDPERGKANIERLRRDAANAGLDLALLVNPAWSRVWTELAQAALVVDATGVGSEAANIDLIGANVMSGLAAGSQTCAFEGGAGAEIITAVGSGSTFRSIGELTDLLAGCEATGVEPGVRERAASLFSDDAFLERSGKL